MLKSKRNSNGNSYGRPRRAAILAGGAGLQAWAPPWAGSKLFLDVGGETVLERQCRWLATQGISEALVLTNESNRSNDPPRRVAGVALHWRFEALPIGTAGALRDARDFIGRDDILVLGENVVPFDVDLPEPAPAWGSEVLLQLFVQPLAAPAQPILSLDDDGFVRHVDRRAACDERRRPARPLGLYRVHPRALEYVPESGYFDLQEQLVAALLTAGFRVEASVADGNAQVLTQPSDTLRAMHLRVSTREAAADEKEIAPGVRTRGSVAIAASAQILGPVLLDDGVEIAEGARIVGPAYVGPGARVESGALVRESHIGMAAWIGSHAAVSSCLVGRFAAVKSGEMLTGVLRYDRDEPIGVEDPRRDVVALRAPSRRGIYDGSKRALDVALSLAGLVASAPLVAALAVAIRLDSPGPVFYLQRRCGRGGREFPVIKFRTMHVAADRELARLRELSERDGPVFKLTDDPRVTRLGALLRRTSLDELPQLVNVLLGQMSLVGPRPLRMEEMQYAPQWRDLRLSVKPGLTGPWQCHARRSNDFGDWVRYDSEYVLARPSLRRDISLLWQTAVGVASGRLRDR